MHDTMKEITIIVFGGSGNWAGRRHFPVINRLFERSVKIKVIAICDPVDPYSNTKYDSLKTLLERDKPIWIDPTKNDYIEKLEKIAKEVNTAIISSNPIFHMKYISWSLDNEINIICDKPVFINKDAAWENTAAKQIRKDYSIALKKYKAIKKRNNNYKFDIVLARRAWRPFMTLFKDFNDQHIKTGANLTHADIILNNGVHRFSGELLDKGAHGYVDGVGVLAHSSYHYIDILANIIELSKDNLTKISISVPYVLRISDYLKSKRSKPLDELLKNLREFPHEEIKHSKSTLNSEMDCLINLTLYGKKNEKAGNCIISFNNSTFTPRLSAYNPNILNPDNNGARMHQLYFAVNQGPVQNWIIRQDHVFGKNNKASFIERKHPLIGSEYQETNFEGDSEFKYLGDEQFIENIFMHLLEDKSCDKSMIFDLESQKTSIDIFGAIYESISKDFKGKKNNIEINLK